MHPVATRIIRLVSAFPLKGDDLVALTFSATLLAPLWLRMMGLEVMVPFGMSTVSLAFMGIVVTALIYVTGIKTGNDFTRSRLYWLIALTIAVSVVLGWLIETRSDAYFTRTSLYQVSAVLLVLSIVACAMETHAARGTPSDVLATGTSNVATVTLAIQWLLIGMDMQITAVVLMLMTAVLIVLTIMLRLPGAIVPIYRRRTTRKMRRMQRQREARGEG